MNDFLVFISNHWAVSGLFVLSLLLFLGQEAFAWRQHGWRLSPQALTHALNHKGAKVLDLRSQPLFEKGHIVGAISLPEARLDLLLKRFPETQKSLILVCATGVQSARLVQQMRAKGYSEVAFLGGGMATWLSEHYPLVKGV